MVYQLERYFDILINPRKYGINRLYIFIYLFFILNLNDYIFFKNPAGTFGYQHCKPSQEAKDLNVIIDWKIYFEYCVRANKSIILLKKLQQNKDKITQWLVC